MASPPAGPAIRAWKPSVAGIREVFHARFIDHAYPRHVHDAWTLFIVDEGAISYDLDRHARGAVPAMVAILPPNVVHDGRPATSRGFHKRVLYLETEVLGEALIGPAVDRPVIPDPALRHQVAALHDALACPDDALEAETRFALVTESIRRSFGVTPAEAPEPNGNALAEALRAYLDGHLFEPVTLAAAAARLGAGQTRVARSFSDAFGVPPYAYLLGRRLHAARDRILGGQALADVAAETGFADQAHLSRRFKQFFGATPGRFARRGNQLATPP